MNERIREIITECETEYSTSYEPSYDMEKFAESIVRECMSIVSKAGNSKAEILWNLEELIWSNK